MNYIIVTPAKNESNFIDKTIRSVVSQTIKPQAYYIFDDDSTDSTTDIVKYYQKDFPFIQLIQRPNFKPDYKSTWLRDPAIFNYLLSCNNIAFDFLFKIDADIDFASDHFEKIIKEFQHDPTLGIASGRLIFNGRAEKIRTNVTRGAMKCYRYECFKSIGGSLIENRGFDSMDGIAARSKGWKTKTLPYNFNHLKPEGIRLNSFYNHKQTGMYKAQINYYFLYFLLTLIKSTFIRPLLIAPFVQLYGYLIVKCGIKKLPQIPLYITDQIRAEQKKKIVNPIALFN